MASWRDIIQVPFLTFSFWNRNINSTQICGAIWAGGMLSMCKFDFLTNISIDLCTHWQCNPCSCILHCIMHPAVSLGWYLHKSIWVFVHTHLLKSAPFAPGCKIVVHSPLVWADCILHFCEKENGEDAKIIGEHFGSAAWWCNLQGMQPGWRLLCLHPTSWQGRPPCAPLPHL